MICAKCGSVVEEDSLFCGMCGNSLVRKQDPTAVLTIGRDSDNTIVVNDDSVLAHHAVIRVQDGGLLLEDLHSSNGTFVNGSRILLQRIEVGDEVRLGDHALLDWDRVGPLLKLDRLKKGG